MEAFGAATAVAGLFGTCLQIVERVDAIKDSGVSSRAAMARFGTEKLLLAQWGRDVGIEDGAPLPTHHESLDDPAIAALVVEILNNIREICQKVDGSFKNLASTPAEPKSIGAVPTGDFAPVAGGLRRAPTGDFAAAGLRRAPAGVFDTGELAPAGESSAKGRSSKMAKLGWALRGQARVAPKLDQLGVLIERLCKVVPVSDSELRRALESLEKQRDSDVRAEVKAWLEAPWTIDLYDRSRRRRLDQTCEWIFEREVFLDWQSTTPLPTARPKFLWINGPAGYGKTILSAKIIERASELGGGGSVAYYFMSSDSHTRRERDPFSVVRSWLHQIVSQHSDALGVAHGHWETKASATAGEDEVVKVLSDILRSTIDGCTLIVDGLDESAWPDISSRADDRDRNSAVGFFGTLAEITENTNTRVLLVSRKEAYLDTSFASQIASKSHIWAAEIPIQPGDVRLDASALSEAVVDRRLPNKSKEQRSELAEKMLAKSDGMFLWIKMIENDLSEDKNKRKLLQMVDKAPTAIGSLYDRNWSRIIAGRDQHRAFSILRWVAFAPRPLTVLELTEALTIPDDDDDDDDNDDDYDDHDDYDELHEDDLPDDIDEPYVRSGIVDLCGSLVEVRRKAHATQEDPSSSLSDATVHIVHFSVLQYLLSRLPLRDGLRSVDKRLSASKELVHTHHLTSLSLRYLATKRVWDERLSLGEKEMPRVLIPLAVGMLGALARQSDKLVVPPVIANMVNRILDPRNGIWSLLHPHVWRLIQQPRSASNIAALWEKESPGENDSGQGMISDNPLCFAAWIGHDALQYMITEVKIPVNRATEDGWTALHIAAMREGGGESLVKLLVECGADVNARTTTNGDTALMVATYMGRLAEARKLLDAGAKQVQTELDRCTPLHSAAMGGHIELARLLLDRGAEVTATNEWAETALHSACIGQSDGVAALLLDRGADVTKRSGHGFLALDYALEEGQDIWRRLLGKAVSLGRLEVNRPGTNGWTLLHGSIIGANPAGRFAGSATELLLDLGADLEAKSNQGTTPLILAAERGRMEWLQGLIDRGANINALGPEGDTPLIAAVRNGHVASASLLLSRGADVSAKNSQGWDAGHLAAASGNSACLGLLLEHRADINAKTNEGQSLILLATANGATECVEILLNSGASVADADSKQYSAVHLASDRGYIDCLKLLVEKGADPMAINSDLNTAAHLAAYGGKADCLQYLIDLGVDISAKNRRDQTPILHACIGGDIICLKLLVNAGADINAKDKDFNTPVSFAAGNGNLDCLKLLLAAGAACDVKDVNGRSAVLVTAKIGHLGCLKLLLEAGADCTAICNRGCNAVHYAAMSGHINCLEFLLDRGADVMAIMDEDWTAAHLAAFKGNLGCLELLLDRGADIMAATSGGFNPAHFAAEEGKLNCLELLLDRGADWSARTLGQGLSVVHAACSSGNPVCLELLFNRGADHLILDGVGRSLLGRVCNIESGREAILDALLGRGLDPLHQDIYGMTPLAVAVAHQQEALVLKLLAATQGDFDLPDKFGRTLLWWARRGGNVNETLVDVLQREAERRGVTLLEPVASPRAQEGEAAGDLGRDGGVVMGAFCDVCTLNLHFGDLGYKCHVCWNGQLVICRECFELGARCLADYHVLDEKRY
ncbi:hypothetical protein MAPG_10197 [Magnaporthiopsis poae ATCC 64411]|uniref:NACHT domain-containing protein n=1 Tax=Magnaporthiopsis poae (strain ATCC 64411 / 73-15) TaxID=644358 RepID=A0A0C4EBY5_MAGP6|nr:hypothetical protein MAPG_10197 [Magnaporthiopsis poae ATCC 64411]